ncbi:peptidase S1 [Nostoc sp. CENA543]|uniref:S1 family peptidase n=1 Tax=Nostoc sp. CENA543 TaxID=1869241 RepID=UPI000CA1C73C|nr:serine protease [Nostoc sp. CENA543]AUT03339.1 peptidase S1 [Nostoc sp. CENA543]
MSWRIFKLITCISGLSILLSASTTEAFINPEHLTITQPFTQLTAEQLHQKANKISVKILSTEYLGTGIILSEKKSVYTVLTNAHVLRADKPPYRIQTEDGKTYPANMLKKVNFQNYDLALLQFTSSKKTYHTASFGASPKVGDEVFIAGFPSTEETENISFTFISGKVSLILTKALEGGYQVGYTNRLEKGMSGGALLNNQGEVVGVNGLHAYPLWDIPSVFIDGSQAEEQLHQQITQLSWAVPMDKIVSMMPPSDKPQTVK